MGNDRRHAAAQRVPHLERADVSRAKIVGYLLSPSHPVGQSKARFFLGLGFRFERWEELKVALVAQASGRPATARTRTPFGSKYVVDGPIQTPRGGSAEIRTVWFVEAGGSVARFVTAYPLPGRNR